MEKSLEPRCCILFHILLNKVFNSKFLFLDVVLLKEAGVVKAVGERSILITGQRFYFIIYIYIIYIIIPDMTIKYLYYLINISLLTVAK